MSDNQAFDILHRAILNRTAVAGVIGLGYVGLPLSAAIARNAFRVIGFDTDESKPPQLNAGNSYIGSVQSSDLEKLVERGQFTATSDFDRLKECDVIVICVPTPLTRYRQPDLSHVESSARQIAKRLRREQLVILESTTYPGTTREIVQPILESTGLSAGSDFFIGFSPE